MKNKGQMFLIMSMIIIVTLMVLKSSMDLPKIMETKRYMEMGLERKEFNNIKDELTRTIEFSYYQSSDIAANVKKFISFARNHLKARTVVLKGIAVESIFPTVAAGVDTRMNVTVFNFFDSKINSLNLSFIDSTTLLNDQTFTSISDGQTIETNFTINTNADKNYTLSAFYLLPSENKTEEISIPAKIGKSTYVGFFDIRFVSERLEQRDRITLTYDLT